jgi:hypothetical protein
VGIPKLVLAQLGDLDPGERGERPAGRDQLGPGGFRIATPTEPPQQPGPLAEQAALRPWRVTPDGIRGRPGVGQGIASRPPPEVRPMAWRPPGTVVVGIRSIRDRWSEVADRQPTARSGGWAKAVSRVREWRLRVALSARAGDRRLEAGECLLVPAGAGVGPRQAGEVTRRRFCPAVAVGVAAVDVDEQAREGADVLVVMADHLQQRCRLPEPQELEVARRDLPAPDVGVPAESQEHGLDGPEAGVGHPVPEDAAHESQQVEVAGVDGRALPSEAVARDEERPVEAPAVVRHEPGVRRDVARELCEQRWLVRVIRQEQLDLPKAAPFPPAETDEERERPGRGREPGRLCVEAEQGSVRRWLTR